MNELKKGDRVICIRSCVPRGLFILQNEELLITRGTQSIVNTVDIHSGDFLINGWWYKSKKFCRVEFKNLSILQQIQATDILDI